MVLAMAVLLLQFPLAITPANAASSPIILPARNSAVSASAGISAGPLSAVQPASGAAKPAKLPIGLIPVPTSSSSARVATPAGNDVTAAVAKPSPAARDTNVPAGGQPPMTADGSAAVAEPIIYSFQPLAGSIAQLTGPAFSEIILPPPTFRPPYELPATHRRLWLALSTAEHSAATYDAWSTRRALAAGRVEADPLMRPFAGSAALYPAIQLVPFGLDYLAHRLQRSSGWGHRIWWVPQSAATVTFLFSGSYNIAHTN